MALILNIDTSTSVCSVALSNNYDLVCHLEVFESFSHASQLTILIQQLFAKSNTHISSIDAVAVSSGPGSYTGLTIGVSTAKGLCYALGKPLLAIGSLDILAWPVVHRIANSEPQSLFCPMIDARRMEVFTSVLGHDMENLEPVSAEIINEDSFSGFLKLGKVYFFGDGAAKCKDTITHPNAIFLDGQFPLAKHMANLAFDAYQANCFEDVAYFEPHYLKEFVATLPKNKVVG